MPTALSSPPDQDAAPLESSCPIPVGTLILGWLCIAGGLVSVFDFVSMYLLNITTDTWLGMVLLPIGIGILRASSHALGVATALLCVIAALCVFRLSVFAGNAMGYSDISLAPKSTVRWLALIAILGLTVVARVVLSSPEAERWFQSKHAGRIASSRGQFGLIAILALTFFCAIIFTRLQSPAYTFHPMQIRTQLVPSTVDRSKIHYATRQRRGAEERELVFVLFQTETRTVSFPGVVEKVEDPNEYDPRLTLFLPDRDPVMLPGTAQLYHMRDGVLTQRPERVNLFQMNTYLRSRPMELDLQALIDTPFEPY